MAAGVLGPFVGVPFVSLWTAIMGLFVYRTASVERAHARFEARFGDRTVGDVMTRDPETIRGWMTVQAFADELAHGAGAPPCVAGARMGRVDRGRRDARRLARVPIGRTRRRSGCRTSRCR